MIRRSVPATSSDELETRRHSKTRRGDVMPIVYTPPPQLGGLTTHRRELFSDDRFPACWKPYRVIEAGGFIRSLTTSLQIEMLHVSFLKNHVAFWERMVRGRVKFFFVCCSDRYKRFGYKSNTLAIILFDMCVNNSFRTEKRFHAKKRVRRQVVWFRRHRTDRYGVTLRQQHQSAEINH